MAPLRMPATASVPARLSAAVRQMRVVALWPLLLRLAVLVTGDAAVVLAAPVRSVAAVATLAAVAVVPALATALFAGSRWVLAFHVLVVALATLGLLAQTGADQAGLAGSRWPQMLALACVLYLHHTCAAVAEALPLTADVHPDALARLGRRLAVVVAATVLAGLLIVVAAAALGGGHAPSVVPLVGLLLAAGVTLVPAVLLRRG
jgi:hypothetical protein